MGRVRNISSDLHRAATGSSLRVARVPKEVAADKPKRPKARKGAIGAAAKKRKLVTSELPYEEFDTVWEALGFAPQEAANLQARSMLMIQIEKLITDHGWTQAIAAKHCGVTQPRINDLLRGKIDKFSIDALVNMATALGKRIDFELKAA